MKKHEISIERRLRIELRRKLGWRDINNFGGVYCWSGPDEVVVLTEHVGINISERFTFPVNTPADEVVDSVLLELTFLK